MGLPPEIRRWRDLASTWADAAERMRTLTADVSARLVERLAPDPHERILDIACGAGDPAIELASRASAVVAADGAPRMLEALVAHRAGSRPWPVAAAAERLPFAPESFDALSCRFGAMFVDAPSATFAHWRELLRPGGRAVLAVWGPLASNPYFTLVSETLDEMGHAAPTPSDEVHSPFEWAEPGSLAGVLREAGFVSVDEDQPACALRLEGIRPEGFVDFQLELSLSVRERCAELDSSALEELRRHVAEAAAAWDTSNGLVIPSSVIFVSAERAPA